MGKTQRIVTSCKFDIYSVWENRNISVFAMQRN